MQANGSVEIRRGQIVLPQLQPGQRAVVRGLGAVRFETNRRIVIGNGAEVIAHLIMDDTALDESSDEVRLQAYRPVQISDGTIKLARLAICNGAIIECQSNIWAPRANDCGASGNCLTGIAAYANLPIVFKRCWRRQW